MESFPKNYIAPSMPDLTLNQFREKLSVVAAMELDKLIRWQHLREIREMITGMKRSKGFLMTHCEKKTPTNA